MRDLAGPGLGALGEYGCEAGGEAPDHRAGER